MAQGVKALVVACNTVSAVALDLLRVELDIPVLGVIEPGAAAAVRAADDVAAAVETAAVSHCIGVLGTVGTIHSGAYQRAVQQLSTRYFVVAEPAPLLVPLVEEGWLEGQVPELAVERYLRPLVDAGTSVIVLGCTHYPLLRAVIERVAHRLAGRPIPIVDSAQAAALTVQRLLAEQRIVPRSEGGPEDFTLLVTDQPTGFQQRADRFLGQRVSRVEQIDLPPT